MRCSAGSQKIFVNKQSEACYIFSSDREWSSRRKNVKIKKSYIRLHISSILCQLYVYIGRFQSFDVLLLARDALWDLRYFLSTNNLRLVKFFPAIINELSQQKCENHEIVHFVSCFEYLCRIPDIYWIFLDFCVLVQARSALRDLRYFFSTNNLRLVKKCLEIIKEALIAKICKTWKTWFSSQIPCILSILYTFLNVF